MLTLPQKQQINLLISLQQYKELNQFFKEYEITDEDQKKNVILLASCGVKKMGSNFILNYQFFEKIGFNKASLLVFMKDKKKTWKNWATFKLPTLSWNEEKVGEWLENLPEDVFYQTKQGYARDFALIVYKLYKETGELITIERAREKSQLAVDPSEFSELEWKYYDAISDKLVRMSAVAEMREEKDLKSACNL